MVRAPKKRKVGVDEVVSRGTPVLVKTPAPPPQKRTRANHGKTHSIDTSQDDEFEGFLGDSNERISSLEKEFEDLKVDKKDFDFDVSQFRETLSKTKKDVKDLKAKLPDREKSVEDLNVNLETTVMDKLMAGDQAFDKAKAHTLFLYPTLDLLELGFFNTTQNGCLVLEEDSTSTSSLEGDIGCLSSPPKDELDESCPNVISN
ncbi:hypothetical protein RYX36_026408 [Vicia faba]